MSNYLRLNKLSGVLCFLLLYFSISLISCTGGKVQLKHQKWTRHELPEVQFDKKIYACQISGTAGLKKYSFSGILLLKTMEDSCKRVVFQSEAGFTFFDFEWDKHNVFRVIQIQDKMNNSALIKTLKKDFEVLFHINYQKTEVNSIHSLIKTDLERGYAIYAIKANHIYNINIINERHRKVVSFENMGNIAPTTLPDKLIIKHHTARFNIRLERFEL